MNRRLLRGVLALLCLVVGLSLWAQAMPTAKIGIQTTPPGATVFLKNKIVGYTPIQLKLGPGAYHLRLSLIGYQEESAEIEIDNPPKDEVYSYPLTKSEDGTLKVLLSAESMMDSSGRADEAGVYLDGTYKGQTPLIIDPLPPGSYTLQVKKLGFLPFEQKVAISREQVSYVTAKLVSGRAVLPAKPSPPIYLATGSTCCSQALRKGIEALRGIWGDGNVLLAVGDNGAIERSENGGASWNSLSSPTTTNLHAIWGSGSTVLAVGEEGTILRSKDAGLSWSVQQISAGTLRSIWGADLKNIYTVGDNGVIFFSSNEGKTWAAQESSSAEALFGVHGLSAKEIYVVGEHGKILRRVNNAWSFVQSGTTKDLYAVSGAYSGALIVAGRDGTILRSTDGASWYTQKSVGPVSIYSLSRSAKTLYAVGDVVLRSVDDGLSWHEISSSMEARSSWLSSGSLVLVGQ